MINPCYYHEQGGHKYDLSEKSIVAVGEFMQKNCTPSIAWILGKDFAFLLKCGADSYFSFVRLYEFNKENTPKWAELQKVLALSRHDTVIVTTKTKSEVLRDFRINEE